MSKDKIFRKGWASVRVVLFALSILGLASMAQAGTQLYGGSLIIEGFGNDTTDGTTYPFNTFVILGVPFGVDCNANYGPFSTPCGGTYPEGQHGAPLVGSDTAITAGTGTTRTFVLPSAGIARYAGTPATSNSFTTSVNGIQRPINCTQSSPTPGGGCGVPGGSFSYYFPYIYSFTYADLKNDNGSFFAGGGPGNFTYAFTTGSVTNASITVTQGGNQFGGAMKLLGSFYSFVNVANTVYGGVDVGSADWLFNYVGAGSNTSAGVVTKAYTKGGSFPTAQNKYQNTLDTTHAYSTGSVKAFGWTTGYVTITATGRGPFDSVQARNGGDNRTSSGKGTIQLVSPMLTHWLAPAEDYETVAMGIMRLDFVPEPTKGLMLVAGISLLGLLYRRKR